MLALRRADDRGCADHGWLKSFHSFSFADYQDPLHMGFGPLRVINEDRIRPGTGFGTHGHRNMEIISYVLSGALAHEDSMGTGSIIMPGDVQRMSAGRGVLHSEHNAAAQDTHFLQIWIEPDVADVAPGYEQKHFDAQSRRGVLRLIASPDGREGSVSIHQNAFVYASLPAREDRLFHTLVPGRRAYVHVALGRLAVNGQVLSAGDALKASEVAEIVLQDAENAEVLLFDLP